MGERANICVIDEYQREIYLYSHFGGPDLAIVLKEALRRGKNRWKDFPYLTRIIFSEMIQDEVMEETGYGISTYQTDNEYNILCVDVKNQKVSVGGSSFMFYEYIGIPDKILLGLMGGNHAED